MRAFLCVPLFFLTFAAAADDDLDPMITGEPPSAAPAPAPPPQPSSPALAVPPAKAAPSAPVAPGASSAAAAPSESARPLTDRDTTSKADRLDALFAELKRAPSTEAAEQTVDKIQAEWAESGSATVDLMLLWASQAISGQRNAAAFDFLDQAILLKPDFAEAWNRRATLNYVADDYGKSLADIERTLQLEPRHFGALMGLGAILEATDRKTQAMEAYLRVLEISPTLKAAQDAVGRLSEEMTGQRI
jgi:tetratricopeptide (TPR) repeat protein